MPNRPTSISPRPWNGFDCIRAGIASHDGARRFRGLGVDVFLGHARFVDDRHVDVDGRRLRFRRGGVATGARARLPDIPGLPDSGALTNENVFNPTALPSRTMVLGGGPIGCQLAKASARLGSKVTLVHNKAQILDRENPEAAAIVRSSLESDGVHILAEARVESVSKNAAVTGIRVHGPGSNRWTLVAEALLVATGRAPNVEGLGLDAAGVDGDAVRGVHVDDHLRTRNPSIHACGDVCLESKFTHMADFSARIVIRNALFALGPLGRRRVTYTDPEIVQVGLGLRGIQNGRTAFYVFTVPFDSVDRSITEDETEGSARAWGCPPSRRRSTPTPPAPRCFGSWATSTSEPVSLRGADLCFMGSTRWVGGWAEAPEAVPFGSNGLSRPPSWKSPAKAPNPEETGREALSHPSPGYPVRVSESGSPGCY